VANDLAAICNGLIEQTQGITHTSPTGASQRYETSFLKCQLVLHGHVPKSVYDFDSGDPTEVVMLAS
jgi:hypothetical protein